MQHVATFLYLDCPSRQPDPAKETFCRTIPHGKHVSTKVLCLLQPVRSQENPYKITLLWKTDGPNRMCKN